MYLKGQRQKPSAIRRVGLIAAGIALGIVLTFNAVFAKEKPLVDANKSDSMEIAKQDKKQRERELIKLYSERWEHPERIWDAFSGQERDVLSAGDADVRKAVPTTKVGKFVYDCFPSYRGDSSAVAKVIAAGIVSGRIKVNGNNESGIFSGNDFTLSTDEWLALGAQGLAWRVAQFDSLNVGIFYGQKPTDTQRKPATRMDVFSSPYFRLFNYVEDASSPNTYLNPRLPRSRLYPANMVDAVWGMMGRLASEDGIHGADNSGKLMAELLRDVRATLPNWPAHYRVDFGPEDLLKKSVHSWDNELAAHKPFALRYQTRNGSIAYVRAIDEIEELTRQGQILILVEEPTGATCRIYLAKRNSATGEIDLYTSAGIFHVKGEDTSNPNKLKIRLSRDGQPKADMRFRFVQDEMLSSGDYNAEWVENRRLIVYIDRLGQPDVTLFELIRLNEGIYGRLQVLSNFGTSWNRPTTVGFGP